MLKEDRHQFILNEVSIRSRVLLSDLSDRIGVSIDTVRRDVNELDHLKKLNKVHGGAISLGYNSSSVKNQKIFQFEKKIIIAEKAIKLLKDGNIVLMGGGTTNLEVARMLPANLKLMIFTPSLPIAMQLLSLPNVDVHLLGGKISKEAQICIGAFTINALADIKADYCFLGTGYLDIENGLTEFDYDVVQLKKAMIRAAKKSILLTISDKLHSVQRFKTCDLSAIDTLITELSPEDPLLLNFANYPIKIK